MTGTTSVTTETKSSRRDPPQIFRREYKAQVKKVERTLLADCEKLRSERSHVHLIENKYRRECSIQSLEDDIATVRLRAKRVIGKLKYKYETRWFLWRSSLPISLVTGIQPSDILFGDRTKKTVQARKICLWMTWIGGDFSYYRIARVIGCDHSTVIFSVKMMTAALENTQSELFILLQDVFRTEMGAGWSQENHLRRANRRRPGGA